MKTTFVQLVLFDLVLCGMTSCSPIAVLEPPVETASKKEVTHKPLVDAEQITQISVINSLMLGQYDGVMSIGQMLNYGDFGLGTLDHLDGELIVLDGTAYQAQGDGSVAEVDPNRTTPFAVVTPFETDGEFHSNKIASLVNLDGLLDNKIEHTNNFIAIRIDGRFGSITVRSVKELLKNNFGI